MPGQRKHGYGVILMEGSFVGWVLSDESRVCSLLWGLVGLEKSGLVEPFWGDIRPPPYIFVIGSGGIKCLGMLETGCLGMLEILPPWVFIVDNIIYRVMSFTLTGRGMRGL